MAQKYTFEVTLNSTRFEISFVAQNDDAAYGEIADTFPENEGYTLLESEELR